MTLNLSRRGLAAALLGLVTIPAALAAVPPAPIAPPSPPVPEAPDIFDLIRAHRDALAEERRAVANADRAARLGLPRLAELRAERNVLRKVRHGARRALRFATPRTNKELLALTVYYGTLPPSPDPQDVAGTCRRDLDAARLRMRRA